MATNIKLFPESYVGFNARRLAHPAVARCGLPTTLNINIWDGLIWGGGGIGTRKTAGGGEEEGRGVGW